MTKKILILCFISFLFSCKVKEVILDTDIDSDVDDVQAISLLHYYQNSNTVNVKGMIVTSNDTYSYECADAINNFYNKSDIPIGFLKTQTNIKNFSKYTKQVSDSFDHSIKHLNQTEESAVLYRKLLNNSKNNSVILITIGHLTSFQNLLKSQPDSISPLSGKELAHLKIKKWICMGGQFPEGKEANFYRPDPQSTLYCIDNWDKEVVFCGWEVGNKIITGGTFLKTNLPEKHPMYLAYNLYNGFIGRPAWDQVAVLLLDKKANSFFDIEKNGYVMVNPDGSNRWIHSNTTKKMHRYVKLKSNINPDSIAKYIDDKTLN